MKVKPVRSTTLWASSTVLFGLNLLVSIALASEYNDFKGEYKQWLKQEFSEQHQELMPVIAVADMLFACNNARAIGVASNSVSNLIAEMDKNQLAVKLALCLGDDDIKSDQALNFGLQGCFHAQLAKFPEKERQQKLLLVNKAILALSRAERQKSFTKCVNAQAMQYLK